MREIRLTHPKFYKQNNCYFAVDKTTDLIVEVDLDTSKIEPSDYFDFDFGTEIQAWEFWMAYDKAIKNLNPYHENIEWEEYTPHFEPDSRLFYIKFTSTLIPAGTTAYAEIHEDDLQPCRYEDDTRFLDSVLDAINDGLEYTILNNKK